MTNPQWGDLRYVNWRSGGDESDADSLNESTREKYFLVRCEGAAKRAANKCETRDEEETASADVRVENSANERKYGCTADSRANET